MSDLLTHVFLSFMCYAFAYAMCSLILAIEERSRDAANFIEHPTPYLRNHLKIKDGHHSFGVTDSWICQSAAMECEGRIQPVSKGKDRLKRTIICES